MTKYDGARWDHISWEGLVRVVKPGAIIQHFLQLRTETETLTLKYSLLTSTVVPCNAEGRKRCRDWPDGDIQSRSVRRET